MYRFVSRKFIQKLHLKCEGKEERTAIHQQPYSIKARPDQTRIPHKKREVDRTIKFVYLYVLKSKKSSLLPLLRLVRYKRIGDLIAVMIYQEVLESICWHWTLSACARASVRVLHMIS